MLGLALFGPVPAPGESPGGGSAESLSLGVHPYLPAPELKRRFRPLVRHLRSLTGLPTRLVVASSYEEHIQRVGTDQLDLAFLGPASYVELVERFGPKPLLARLEVKGAPVFYGRIVIRDNSPLREVAELAGKRFAFGSPHSTMSYTLPRYVLLRAGIGMRDLGGYEFLGTHVNVALAVLQGRFDAGAVKDEVFAEYQSQGLRILATSPAVSEHLFLTRADLSGELIALLRRDLLTLGDKPGGRHILRSIKSSLTGTAPVSDHDYDNLRKIRAEVRAAKDP